MTGKTLRSARWHDGAVLLGGCPPGLLSKLPVPNRPTAVIAPANLAPRSGLSGG